ncbi:hypothetical protein [Bradyrhizobium sp. SZCCHNR3003]|uniref:hypothetical protein n=1 Tax=Bradyrhizobium TaxID=374 RepID=UPI0039676368
MEYSVRYRTQYSGAWCGWPLLALFFDGSSRWSSSGALAVARATMPLVFYDKAASAKASAQIALPLNLLSAVWAPVLAALLTSYGGNASPG